MLILRTRSSHNVFLYNSFTSLSLQCFCINFYSYQYSFYQSIIWVVSFFGQRKCLLPNTKTMFKCKITMICWLFQGLLSLVYLTSSNMYALINYVSFVNWLAIGLSVTVLLYFRWKRPNMERPIKVSLIYDNLVYYSSFIKWLAIGQSFTLYVCDQ